ncbi:YkvA family protein [Pseudomarimonas salicorniae]|uniref:YkvA family protein n=1 Tax=Pseudomarimonas salicorniae TaxID=2933270 RepID=A0ABT0GCI9_9GAMM|nr:YkvA family protein [Lysobacter sp. CAU 1642]MCK7592251.1 YkvA family protein [Lysobacter sp. CAU 1642]
MSFSINIDLSDRDLEHFQAAQKQAVDAAAKKSDQEIINAASALLVEATKITVPDFIGERLAKLDDMIAMLNDEGFALPEEDRKRVLSALVYFADPKDIIPDSVPVLGFLDDAIMIELCTRELKHEIEAYEDFCDYRQREADSRGLDPATIGRADFLDSRRAELIDRMHSRRNREQGGGFGHGYGSSSGWASGKSYISSSSWRPGRFRTR